MFGERPRGEGHHGPRRRARSASRSRSRSPYRDNKRRHDRHDDRSSKRDVGHLASSAAVSSPPLVLPFNAQPLGKHDYRRYKPMFALYLDIQKQIALDDIPEREARGRWKSFVGKWNRGELAEGWYDPSTFAKSQRSLEAASPPLSPPQEAESIASEDLPDVGPMRDSQDDHDDDEYGPALPSMASTNRHPRRGAVVPSFQDLELQREQAREDRDLARADLKQERRDYRKQEQAKLDDLLPKAEAGSRERQSEKRREAAAANRAFASARTDAGGAMEVGDEDLMGGADGVDEYRKAKKEMERKKNEREIRRDEALRARQAEREERVRAYKDKEDKTMAGLIALAKQKYG